jgi:hypothetical protein
VSPPRTIRPIPVEDLSTREPEWEPIELGYGQPPTLRDFEYDPLHDDVRVFGPVIVIHPPIKPE